MVSKFEERVVVDGAEAFISTNLYPGTVYPHGFNIQKEFRLRPWPTFRYGTAEFEIEKSVTMIHGENTTVVAYRNLGSRGPVELLIRPLLACRDYNGIQRRNDEIDLAVEQAKGVFAMQPVAQLPKLYFHCSPVPVGAEMKGDWYYKFTYPVEEERGLDFEEDLFTPVEWWLRIPAGQVAYITISTDRKNGVAPERLLAGERERRKAFEAEPDPTRQALLIAADQFISRRGKDNLTVLAGYPWFTDWGRDTMIALPGLTLTSNRLDVAGKILRTFARYCDRGQIPNVFPDAGETPEYNTVDASLWFIVAAWKYWKAGGAVAELMPALREVVKYYREGTR